MLLLFAPCSKTNPTNRIKKSTVAAHVIYIGEQQQAASNSINHSHIKSHQLLNCIIITHTHTKVEGRCGDLIVERTKLSLEIHYFYKVVC